MMIRLELLAQLHEVVVADAHQGGPGPDHEEHDGPDLGDEPQHRPPPGVGPRPEGGEHEGAPAAQEQGHAHSRDVEHAQ